MLQFVSSAGQARLNSNSQDLENPYSILAQSRGVAETLTFESSFRRERQRSITRGWQYWSELNPDVLVDRPVSRICLA